MVIASRTAHSDDYRRDSLAERIIDHVPDAIVTIDKQGIIQTFNPAAEGMFGYSPFEVIGRNVKMLMQEPDQSRHQEYVDEYARTGEGKIIGVGPRAVVGRHKSGRSVSIGLAVSEIRTGDAACYVAVLRDVSDQQKARAGRMKAEEALSRSEERLRLITDSLPALVAYVDQDYQLTFTNKTFREWHELGDLRKASLSEVLGQTAFAKAKLHLDQALGGEPTTFETERHYPGKGSTAVQVSYVPDRTPSGEVRGAFALVHDISQLKRSAERLRLVTDNYPAPLAYIDRDYCYRFGNKAFEEWFHWPAAELPGTPIQDVMGEDYFKKLLPWINKALDGKRVTFETSNTYADGKTRFLDVTYVPDTEASGKTLGFYVMVHDITQRKHDENALRRSQEALERAATLQAATLDALPANIAVLNGDGVITWVNDSWRAFAEANGYVHPDLGIGEEYFEICEQACDLGEREAAEVRTKILDIIGGSSEVFSLDYPCGTDPERWFRVTATQTKVSGGRRIVMMHLDITKERQAEERFRQAEKSQALASLAGGLSHEINNMLTPIIGLAELTKDMLANDAPERKNLEKIIAASNKAAEIVKGILTFSRRDETKKTKINVTEVASEGVALFRAMVPVDVKTTQTIEPISRQILANPTQIQQVLINLCGNAADAIGGAGTIDIKLCEVRLDEPLDVPGAQLPPGDYVRLTVSDTGSGMNEETMKRIFEPFFSTKEVGKGTGLGLSIIQGIVFGHGGGIQVSSAPGDGTTFEVFLPLAESG